MKLPTARPGIIPLLAPDSGPKAPGYDKWLAADIAAGLDDLVVGRIVSLEDIRAEFKNL